MFSNIKGVSVGINKSVVCNLDKNRDVSVICSKLIYFTKFFQITDNILPCLMFIAASC